MPYKHTFVVNDKKFTKELTPTKAVMNYCRHCVGQKCGGKSSKKDVERCAEFFCPLFPYRMGHRPSA